MKPTQCQDAIMKDVFFSMKLDLQLLDLRNGLPPQLNAGTREHQCCAHIKPVNSTFSPLSEAEQCVSGQMKFSYAFSQRQKTDSLNSRGHHLAPRGNTRLDPDDWMALSGERLPGQVCHRSLCARKTMGQTVGQF